MYKMLGVAAAALALTVAAPASAAVTPPTLIVSNGKLTGATGVNVGGTLYDVVFVDPTDFATGMCTTYYGTCDAAHMNFASYDEVLAAGNALLNTVFATEPYDSHPEAVNGCTSTVGCSTYISFANFGGTTPYIMGVTNFAPGANGFDDLGSGFAFSDASFFPSSSNLAIFNRQTASVPEPATWAMMLLGFGGIGLAMRRRNRKGLQYA